MFEVSAIVILLLVIVILLLVDLHIIPFLDPLTCMLSVWHCLSAQGEQREGLCSLQLRGAQLARTTGTPTFWAIFLPAGPRARSFITARAWERWPVFHRILQLRRILSGSTVGGHRWDFTLITSHFDFVLRKLFSWSGVYYWYVTRWVACTHSAV